MPNNLGELIEMQRTKLGLQQKQVAKMVGERKQLKKFGCFFVLKGYCR